MSMDRATSLPQLKTMIAEGVNAEGKPMTRVDYFDAVNEMRQMEPASI